MGHLQALVAVLQALIATNTYQGNMALQQQGLHATTVRMQDQQQLAVQQQGRRVVSAWKNLSDFCTTIAGAAARKTRRRLRPDSTQQ